jgi:hypothetical protein
MVNEEVVFDATALAVPENDPSLFSVIPGGKLPLTTVYVKPLLVFVSPSQQTGRVAFEEARPVSTSVPKLPLAVCQLGGALPPPRPCLEIIIYTSLFMISLIKQT